LSFLRCVPDLIIGAPRDDVDTKAMLHWSLKQDLPVALRYARGKASTIGAAEGRDIAHGEILRHGRDATILAIGPCLGQCLVAAEALEADGFSVGVADARWVKPLDTGLLDSLLDRPIVTVEENTLDGGFGSAVLEYFSNQGRLQELHLLRLGIPDVFSEQATREEQLAAHGLDAQGLIAAVRRYLGAGLHATAS
jgi:1-deoxy-D-xylulose-5-phosphate synthase